MASIIREIEIAASPQAIWGLLRDVGFAHRAFPGVLTECRLEGDLRTVVFAGGMVVKVRIIHIDDGRRRLAYAVIEGRFSHHSAAFEVRPWVADSNLVVWTSDFLPDEAEAVVGPLMERSAAALQRAAAAL